MVKLERGIAIWIKPNGKSVVGIGDGKGQMAWIQTNDILDAFPKNYEKLQTVIFRIADNATVKWGPEKDYERYKNKYNDTKPIPTPIPAEFGGSAQSKNLPPPPKGAPPGTPTFVTPTTSSPQTTKGYFELILSELAALRRDVDAMRTLLESMMNMPPPQPSADPTPPQPPKEDLGLDETLI